MGLIWLGEERVQGDPHGPGGPPYSAMMDENLKAVVAQQTANARAV